MFGLCERPLQARLSLLFPFLPISGFSQPPLSEWRRTGLLSPWVGRCSPIRSQLGHTPPTGPVWGFAGVVSLAGPPKPHTGPHRAKFGFPPQKTNSPLPLKGEGLGIIYLVCQVFHPEKPGAFPQEKADTSYPRASLDSCLWQLLATTAPHGFNRAGVGLRWCCFPTPPSNRPQIAAQDRVWFHRLFLVRFGFGRADKSFSSL